MIKHAQKWFTGILSIGIFMFVVTNCTMNKNDKLQDEKISKIIASMTLEQKTQLLVGTGMFFEIPDSLMKKWGLSKPAENDTIYSQMIKRVRKYLPGAAGFSAEFPEFGITSMVLADGPAGLRVSPTRKDDEKTYYCTAFPIATNLASSWDTELIESVGSAMGNEVLEYGADIILGPGMNIQRDPLCGRNFEYYSEDPYITGHIAAAMIKGIQSNGVGTSAKHFAANNQETSRLSVNTIVSERALREIYLKGFEIAVTEAQPWTVMSSYNKINGVYTSESYDLLTKILRDDWGFKGFVMTDWSGGSDVVAQMKAGNDMIQPGKQEQIDELIAAVKDSILDESILDKNLTRILSIMLKSPKYKGYVNSNAPDLKAHAQVVRKAGSEGMVLLKNSGNALPLAVSEGNIAVFGTTSYEFICGGTGSGDVNEAYVISLIDGLKAANLKPEEKLSAVYNSYIQDFRAKGIKPSNWFAAMMNVKAQAPEMEVSPEMASDVAKNSELAIITIGRNSGEGVDRTPSEGDFYLTQTEKNLIKNVSESFHSARKKVIVILNVGGVVETASWRDFPDAIVCAWQPGQEAGNSVADVLTGKINPSGKLAITFPVNYSDVPSSKTFPGHKIESIQTDSSADLSGFSLMSRVPWEVIYDEDIFVGYRYYNTFNVPVAYEFGYGLSYTSFEYSDLKLSSTKFKNNIHVSVIVKNTGLVAGREVVQVYLSSPANKMKKPTSVLVAFGKTKLLAPQETEALTFTIDAMSLASFNEENSTWTAESGSYSLKIGSSSRNIKLDAGFELKKEMMVKKVSKALQAEVEIKSRY